MAAPPSVPPPTSLSALPPAAPSHPSISLLPFSIGHDGPAPISTYFHPRPRDPSTPDALKASFRGREIFSTPFPLPPSYTGLIFSTTVPAPPPPAVAPLPPAKRARTMMPIAARGRGRGGAIGTRRSPRKVVQEQRYSLDSDDEDAVMQEPPRAESPSLPLPITVSGPSTPASQPAPKEEEEEDATEEEALGRDLQLLVPLATFEGIQIWHPDMALDREQDVYARNLVEFVGIAAMVRFSLYWREGRELMDVGVCADSCLLGGGLEGQRGLWWEMITRYVRRELRFAPSDLLARPPRPLR